MREQQEEDKCCEKRNREREKEGEREQQERTKYVPSLAEGLPVAYIHITLTKHGPHGHLEGTGIRSRHNANQVVIGHIQNGAALLDHLLQRGQANLRTMRATQRLCVDLGEIITRASVNEG
jgi:hypothetical protein